MFRPRTITVRENKPQMSLQHSTKKNIKCNVISSVSSTCRPSAPNALQWQYSAVTSDRLCTYYDRSVLTCTVWLLRQTLAVYHITPLTPSYSQYMTSPVRRVGLRGYVTLSNKKFRRFGKSCSRHHEDHWVWGHSRGPYVGPRAVWERGSVGRAVQFGEMSEDIHAYRGVTPEANPKHWTAADAKASDADHTAQVGTSQRTQKGEPNQSVIALISWQHTLNSADIMHVFHRHSTVLRTRPHDEP